MVSGYLGGYYSEAGGYYIVNEENAHVWVEAWEEKLGGWVRYDPTPVTEASLQNEGYSTLALYLDLMDYQWARLVMNYDMDVRRRRCWKRSKNWRKSRRETSFPPPELCGKNSKGCALQQTGA